jgi:hypothetical protein
MQSCCYQAQFNKLHKKSIALDFTFGLDDRKTLIAVFCPLQSSAFAEEGSSPDKSVATIDISLQFTYLELMRKHAKTTLRSSNVAALSRGEGLGRPFRSHVRSVAWSVN